MSYSARHCAWLCFYLLAAAVYAEPGLHYEPMYGPLSERFAESQQTALIAGRPLLPDRSRGLIEHKVGAIR